MVLALNAANKVTSYLKNIVLTSQAPGWGGLFLGDDPPNA